MDSPGSANVPSRVRVKTLLDDEYKNTAFGKLARIHANIKSADEEIVKGARADLIRWNHTYTRNRWNEADHSKGYIPQHLLIAHSYGSMGGLRISAVLGCVSVQPKERGPIEMRITLKNLLEYEDDAAEGEHVQLHSNYREAAQDADEEMVEYVRNLNRVNFPEGLLYDRMIEYNSEKRDPIVVVLFENLGLFRTWVRGHDRVEEAAAHMDRWPEVERMQSFAKVAALFRSRRQKAVKDGKRVPLETLLFPDGNDDGIHYLPARRHVNVAVWGDKTVTDDSGNDVVYGAKMTGVVATSMPGHTNRIAKKSVNFGSSAERATLNMLDIVPVYGAKGQPPPSLGAEPTHATERIKALDDPHTTVWFDLLFEGPITKPARRLTWNEIYERVKASVAKMRAGINDRVKEMGEAVGIRLLALWLAARAVWLRQDIWLAIGQTLDGTNASFNSLFPSVEKETPFYRGTQRIFELFVSIPFKREIEPLPPILPPEAPEEEEEERGEEPPEPVVVVEPPAPLPLPEPGIVVEPQPGPPPLPERESSPPLPPRPESPDEGLVEDVVEDVVEEIAETTAPLQEMLEAALEPANWIQPIPVNIVNILLPEVDIPTFQPPDEHKELRAADASGIYRTLQVAMARKGIRADSNIDIRMMSVTFTTDMGSPKPYKHGNWVWFYPSNVFLGYFGSKALGRTRFDSAPAKKDTDQPHVIGWANATYFGGKRVPGVGLSPRSLIADAKDPTKFDFSSELRAPLGGVLVGIIHFKGDPRHRRGIFRAHYDAVLDPSGNVVAYLRNEEDDIIGIMGGRRVPETQSFRPVYFFIRVVVPHRVMTLASRKKKKAALGEREKGKEKA